MPIGDESTRELRTAHDVLAEVYVERLAGVLETVPADQAVLALFCRLAGSVGLVGDIGCGTGRLAPYLASQGLTPRGFDLSPEMVQAARRDYSDFRFEVADLRALPVQDRALDGALCWYSLMFLPEADRPSAYAELARVLKPGAPLGVAFKAGDGSHRRGGRSLDLGIGFDIWWHDPQSLRAELQVAGFDLAFWAGRPPAPGEPQPQGYLVMTRTRPGHE